jgi:hypothetical protein
MANQPLRHDPLAPIVVFVGLAILLLAHAHQFASFLSDDALISLRYARRLVAGHGLTWTTGERVEGYTDLLWVLLAAAGTWLGFDTIATALTLDKLGALLALALLGLSPRTGRASWTRLVAGGGLFAASIPVAVWANGGLEHGLMLGILTVALYRVIRRARSGNPAGVSLWVDGLPLAALALLRADGIVLGFFLVLGAALVRGTGPWQTRLWRLARTFALPVTALLGQTIFRRVYYGAWQPNTAVAKLTLNWDRLRLGLSHLRDGYAASAVLVVAAVLSTIYLARRRSRASIMIPWTLVLGWSLYLAVVGGDIFPGWRQLLFVVPPLAFLVAEFAESFTEWRRSLSVPVLVGMAFLVGFFHLHVQSRDSENVRARRELWEWDGFSIGSLLRQAFGAKAPLFGVDAAGALPYWSELPSLDMLGLNDSYITHHPPPNFGHGPIGHELGDGAYVFSRRPDLIAFNGAAGGHVPIFLSGKQLLAIPEFHQQYQWIKVQGNTGTRATAELWVRRENGMVGVQREPDRILVPGYLLTGQASDAIARLDRGGRLTGETTDKAPGILPALRVPAGRWRVQITPADPGLALDLRCDGRSMERLQTADEAVFDLSEERGIGVALGPRLGAPDMRSIVALEFVRDSTRSPTHRCVPAGQPLSIDLADLAHAKPENFYWAHPENRTIDERGLRARIESARTVARIELSVDNNDVYEVRLLRNGRSLWQGRTTRERNAGGLALRRLDLPAAILTAAGDELTVVPIEGDGWFSVGHVTFSETR